MKYLDRSALQTWVAYVSGTPAGYVELESQPEGNVEIVYFGLLPQFIGQRIGGHLLTVGIQKAWQDVCPSGDTATQLNHVFETSASMRRSYTKPRS